MTGLSRSWLRLQLQQIPADRAACKREIAVIFPSKTLGTFWRTGMLSIQL